MLLDDLPGHSASMLRLERLASWTDRYSQVYLECIYEAPDYMDSLGLPDLDILHSRWWREAARRMRSTLYFKSI